MNSPIKKQKRFKPKVQKSILLESAKAFSENERPSAQDIKIFRDLFYTLVANTSGDDLKTISTVLAGSKFTPRPVAMYLSMESIDIASPFLLYSPVLNTSDLKAISDNRPPAYLDIIKRRQDTSGQVVNYVSAKPNSKDQTEPNLAVNKKKADPSPEESNSAGGPVHVEIRAKPIDRSSELIALANKGGRLERSKIQEKVDLPKADFENILLQSLRDGKRQVFATKLASKTGLEEHHISNYLEKENIGQLASLFRALDIAPTISVRLLLLCSRNLGRDAAVFNQVITMFKKLDIEECRQQFLTLGASFGPNSLQKTMPEKPHFNRLLEDRRRSLQKAETKTISEEKFSSAS